MGNEKTSLFLRAVPVLFVLMWSTGFIGAKYGLPYAGAMTFLASRMCLVIAILLPLALLWRAPWPASSLQALQIMFSGFLIHGVYLGGVFKAIEWGMPAALTALIVGVQPLLTTLLGGVLLGERMVMRHWIGVVLGLFGMLMVLLPRLSGSIDLPMIAYLAAIAALFGMTLGTIYQKHVGLNMDLLTGGVLQNLGALMPFALFAWWFEGFQARWTGEFISAMVWLVLVLSIGAISLLMLMIRHGEVSKVSTLFYLVPPVTTIFAYFMFDEQLVPLQLVGIVIAAFAVWVGTSRRFDRRATAMGRAGGQGDGV